MGRTRRLHDVWRLLSLPLLAFLTLPLIALVLYVPPAQLIVYLGDPRVRQALGLSLTTTLIATVLSVILGTPVAGLLSQRQFRFGKVIDTLITLPTVLPPSAAGLALLIAFGRKGLLGGWLDAVGIRLAFTPAAVMLAQIFVASAFYIKAATIGFASIDEDMKHAARLDGAGGWQVFRYVIVPGAWVALVSGAVMTWARALGEFGATIIFAGNYPGTTQTMPLAIYIGFELDLDVALTLSVILITLSFLSLIVVRTILPQGQDTEGQ